MSIRDICSKQNGPGFETNLDCLNRATKSCLGAKQSQGDMAHPGSASFRECLDQACAACKVEMVDAYTPDKTNKAAKNFWGMVAFGGPFLLIGGGVAAVLGIGYAAYKYA